MDKLYIVVPAYNEEENIETVVGDWYPVVEKVGGESRLVIIDDGSKDTTYQKMQELAKTRPMFLPVSKQNEGHGSDRALRLPVRIKRGGGLCVPDRFGRADTPWGILEILGEAGGLRDGYRAPQGQAGRGFPRLRHKGLKTCMPHLF